MLIAVDGGCQLAQGSFRECPGIPIFHASELKIVIAGWAHINRESSAVSKQDSSSASARSLLLRRAHTIRQAPSLLEPPDHPFFFLQWLPRYAHLLLKYETISITQTRRPRLEPVLQAERTKITTLITIRPRPIVSAGPTSVLVTLRVAP